MTFFYSFVFNLFFQAQLNGKKDLFYILHYHDYVYRILRYIAKYIFYELFKTRVHTGGTN